MSSRTSGAARSRAALFAVFLLGAFVAARAPSACAADEATELANIPAPVTVPARVLRLVPVHYPESARRAGISGTVIVRARIGRDGRVRETAIVHSIPELDEFAMAQVRRFEFVPAKRDGDEVETWVDVPVRFDPALPSGTRGSELVEAGRDTDVDRSFEGDVVVLQQSEPAIPNADDTPLRERIMRGALLLDVIPPPGIEAIHAFRQGDSLAGASTPALRERRKAHWARAAHLAPWWPLPYRRLVSVALFERDFTTLERCAGIILAGRPNDEGTTAMLRRARQLKLAPGAGQAKAD